MLTLFKFLHEKKNYQRILNVLLQTLNTIISGQKFE